MSAALFSSLPPPPDLVVNACDLDCEVISAHVVTTTAPSLDEPVVRAVARDLCRWRLNDGTVALRPRIDVLLQLGGGAGHMQGELVSLELTYLVTATDVPLGTEAAALLGLETSGSRRGQSGSWSGSDDDAAKRSPGLRPAAPVTIFPRVTSNSIHPYVTRLGTFSDDARFILEQFDTSTARGVLAGAMATFQLEEPITARFDRGYVLELWRHHANGNCPDCDVARVLPKSWEHFAAASEDEQHELLDDAVRALELAEKRRSVDDFEHWNGVRRRERLARQYRPTLPRLFAQDLLPGSSQWELGDGVLDGRLVPFLHRMARTDVGSTGRTEVLADLKTSLISEDSKSVYSFPLFSTTFCDSLTQEVKHYEAAQKSSGLPAFRPNSMNNYGVVLNAIGMRPFLSALCRQLLFEVGAFLFPDASGGGTLDDHHSFVVEYGEDRDTFLDMHADDSEVTFNVNLCETFAGSSLVFCGMRGSVDHRKHAITYGHQLGRVVCHAGAHRHGALALTSGERFNLIVWCTSTQERARHIHGASCKCHGRHPAEDPADLVCVSMQHDPDGPALLSKHNA